MIIFEPSKPAETDASKAFWKVLDYVDKYGQDGDYPACAIVGNVAAMAVRCGEGRDSVIQVTCTEL